MQELPPAFGIAFLMIAAALVGALAENIRSRPRSTFVVGQRVRHVISGREGVVAAWNADGSVHVGYDLDQGGECFDAELEEARTTTFSAVPSSCIHQNDHTTCAHCHGPASTFPPRPHQG